MKKYILIALTFVFVFSLSFTSAQTFNKDIKKGSRGTDVKKLQDYLVGKGLLQESTGYYGNQTAVAVKKLQNSFGLFQSGNVMSATRKAIESDMRSSGGSGGYGYSGEQRQINDGQEGNGVSYKTCPGSTQPVPVSTACVSGPSTNPDGTITIRFNLDGGKGDTPNSITVKPDEIIKMPTWNNFSKEGEAFYGWRINQASCLYNNSIGCNYLSPDAEYKATHNVTFYAYWRIKTYGEVPLEDAPYNFSATGVGQDWVKLHWDIDKKYTKCVISYGNYYDDINRSNGATSTAVKVFNGSCGDTTLTNLRQLGSKTHIVYYFKVKGVTADGVSSKWSKMETVALNDNNTEEKNVQKYTFKFDANGGSPFNQEPITITAGESIQMPNSKATRIGYKQNSAGNGLVKVTEYFKGWTTDKNGTNILGSDFYAPYSLYNKCSYVCTDVNRDDNVFYAVYEAKNDSQIQTQKYTVTFNSNIPSTGYAIALTPQTVNARSSITLPSYTDTVPGYTFLGWSTNQNTTTNYLLPYASYTPTSDVILYAVWGSTIKKSDVEIRALLNQEFTLRNKKDYTEAEYIGIVNDNGTEIIVRGTSIYKNLPYGNQGEEVNGFVVGFNGSVDGKGASQFSSNPSLGRSGLNTFETYGYKVSIVSATENTATFIVRKNTTVETQKYTITYEANGAETVHSDAGKQDAYGVVTVKQDVTSGTIATVQDNFYNKYNHTFVKWNTKADTTGVSYNPKDTIKLNDNVTLYAIWKQNTTESTKYIVSFSSNGGSGTTPAEQTVNAGEGISLPKNERMINTSGITRPNPNYISREGYNFVGWYTSSNLCTSTSCSAFAPGMYYKPESGVTLHAIWSPIASQQQEYIVSFNTNGGSSVADKKVSAPNGGYITLPSTTKAGHTFDSWQETGDDILYKVGNSVRISKNTSFDAMWKTNITTTNIYCSINGVSYSSQTEYDTNCKQPISSSVPTNLYTTNVTSNSISLSFTNGTNSRSKCSVYYHTDYEHVKNYNGDMYDGLCGSRTINNLTPNTTYHFKVKAALYTIFNRSVYGDWSDVLSVTTANTGAGIYGGPNTETNTEIPKDWWNNQMVYGASTYQFETTLNRGMQGKEVKELQKFLNSRGFNVEETGYYGDSTKKAVKDFQEMYRKEILDPFGFTEGTGKFGLATMDFVNELLLNNR